MKIYQIYFEEHQKQLLDYIPYYNDDCTVFFENSVIKTLIEQNAHKGSDYFGVVSYSLRQKINIAKTNWKLVKNIANTSVKDFTPAQFEEEIRKNLPDVMSMQRHVPHDQVSFAEQFHPKFTIYYKEIMKKAGYDWKPTHFENVFYCNFFVAKESIYERYVKEMLIQCMEAMNNMPELMQNSHYPKQLRQHLQSKFGIPHYPYHAFLCERFFSFFAHIHNLKCLHY